MPENLKETLLSLPHDVVCEGFELMYLDRTAVSSVPPVTGDEYKAPEPGDFVSLIQYMKKKYNFAELDDFTIEGGQVLFRRGGRRIVISLESSSGSFQQSEVVPEKSDKSDDEDGESRFSRLEL